MGADRERTRVAGKRLHGPSSDNMRRKQLKNRCESPPALVASDNRDKHDKHEPRLRDILPEGGMVWPFEIFILEDKFEMKITAALKKVAPRLSDTKLDGFFSGLFLEATELLQDPTTSGDLNSPVSFLNALHKRESVRLWAKHISKVQFVILFLFLRGARDQWHLDPESFMDIQPPCEVAMAIDEFDQNDALDWSASEISRALTPLHRSVGRIKLRTTGDEDTVMDDDPMTQAGQRTAQALHGQTDAVVGEAGMDNDVDMVVDGIGELTIQHR
ncbi:uncharacterized protein B0H64DRAFT_454300 [Chaetomium fimeti]|uniref:Uncharacterized protein n=1 Tax=Chaetomium fimeti TaxID=1854472 RepID=A0AAE0HLJ7_9PEZI|nr:hypothetical protein B0H64DRAFT_454300 [Chaetomium fimeti]